MNELLHKLHAQEGSSVSFDEWNSKRLDGLFQAIVDGKLKLESLSESDKQSLIVEF